MLIEDLVLVALVDKRRTDPLSSLAASGALLLELVELGHLALREGRVVGGTAPQRPREPLLAEALDAVASDDKQRKPSAWVTRLGKALSKPHKRVLDDMVAAGVLKTDEHSVLFIRWTYYTPADVYAARAAKDRARRALLYSGDEDRALARMVDASGITNRVLKREERPRARDRINRMRKDGSPQALIAKAVKSARDSQSAAA